ncbi:MAG TPA: hypothetical protein VHB02_05965 [Acidimicrobiales bacterium]|nr:hypothetical protein [Acidimicrobiales bacterium]
MPIARVHCPQCNTDTTFEYPADTPAYSGTPDDIQPGAPGAIRWEHGCPPVVPDTTPPVRQAPYVGVFLVPSE